MFDQKAIVDLLIAAGAGLIATAGLFALRRLECRSLSRSVSATEVSPQRSKRCLLAFRKRGSISRPRNEWFLSGRGLSKIGTVREARFSGGSLSWEERHFPTQCFLFAPCGGTKLAAYRWRL